GGEAIVHHAHAHDSARGERAQLELDRARHDSVDSIQQERVIPYVTVQRVRNDGIAAQLEVRIRSLVEADAGDHFPRLRHGKYRIERLVLRQLLRDLAEGSLELTTRARI